MNFHRTDVNRNILVSVTVELDCLACDKGHSEKNSIAAGVPLAVVLSDQSFLPVLPGYNDTCVVKTV